MSINQFGLTPQKILSAVLLVALLIVIFFYYQSLSSPSSTVSLPHSVKTDVLQQQREQQQANKDLPEKRKLTPVTPEEKRVVEEKEYLNTIVEAGDQKIQSLQAEEAALHQQDEQAAAIIAKLDAQVKEKGLSK